MGILNNMMSDNLTDEIDIVSSKVRTSVSRSVRNIQGITFNMIVNK